MEILIVVDMQNDFIQGTLGTKEAQEILSNVCNKIAHWTGEIYFTRDTHKENYLETQEGKNLPVLHCIKNTHGWELHSDIQKFVKSDPINKEGFGSIPLMELLKTMEKKITSITIIGLCTDICVISNAIMLKAFLPETIIKVDASCCAGVTPESHECALNAMKMCQITIENCC